MQPDINAAAAPADGVPVAASGPMRPRPRLLLIGLPPALAEPVDILAGILGWQVARMDGGPVMPPPAELCLAMVPPDAAAPTPPIAVWSPNKNLNEHILGMGLSILEQPPCIQHLEQLLQLCAEMP